jgi:ribosomal protein S18 acetylase RimI-like enzyme
MLIRTATSTDCAAVAKIQVDSYRNAYNSLMPTEYLDAFSYAEQEQDWKDWLDRESGLLLVAENEPGHIIGYVLVQLASEEETAFECEVVALHVNRAYHRQGAGRALLAAAARHMHAQGCRSLGLWVIDGNPAVGFYDRLGGQPTGEHFFEIEELHLRRREIGYVWARIEDLFEPLPPQRRVLFLTGPNDAGRSSAAQAFAASRGYPCALIDPAHIASFVKSGNAHPDERQDEPAQAQWELARRICAEMLRAYYSAGIASVVDVFSTSADFAKWATLLAGLPIQVVVLLPRSETLSARAAAENETALETWHSVPAARVIDTTRLSLAEVVNAIEQALGGQKGAA